MKNSSIFLLVALLFFGCGAQQKEDDLCEMNQSILSVLYQSWGTVKHPVSDGIYFSNSASSVSPAFPPFDGFITYTNVSYTVDGGLPIEPETGLEGITADSLSAGIHTFTLTLDCEKRILFPDDEVTCECVGDETFAELEVEIIDPVYIVFDSLIYSKDLPCTYDFPFFPCPDLKFTFSYYKADELYHIKNQYNYPDYGPMLAALNDTIAIHPSECIIPLSLDDDDNGDDDHIEDYELNPDNMGGWNTGAYQVGPYLKVVITRL